MEQQEKPGRGCGDHDGRDWGKFREKFGGELEVGWSPVENREKYPWGTPWGQRWHLLVTPREGGKPPSIPGDVFWELPSNSWGTFASRKGGRRNTGFSRGWEFPPFPVAIRKRSQCRRTPKSQPRCEQRVWSPLCLDKTFQALIQVRREPRLFLVPGGARPDPGALGESWEGEKWDWGRIVERAVLFLYTTDVNKTALAFPLVSMKKKKKR